MKTKNVTGNNDMADNITTVLFVIYLMALLWILIFKLGVRFSYMDKRRVNLIPFHAPVQLNGKTDFGEMILNVVIFIPLGIYAGILLQKWAFGKKLLLFFLTSLTLETIQFIFSIGAFDITDIITNTFGGLVGLMIFIAIEKVFKNRFKAQKFINIIAGLGTALMVLLLVLLKLNMLPVRFQ